jgi:glycosyltransferase involved in cell wall biosynthesis
MPSIREGFGIVYAEAMACGCVAIGTEGEGIADLIVSGENGYLVPPDDPEAIVETITACLQQPESMRAVADAGRAAALQLTWEVNAAQYLQLFQEGGGIW